MRIDRTDRSLFAGWWFTFDRALFAAVAAISAAGIVVSLAASPAIALKRGLPTFYFVERHIVFVALALVTMLAVSMLTPKLVRRAALVLLLVSVAAMIAAVTVGPEINGARRWIRLGAFSLQPSEFAKPAFTILTAWLLSESQRRPDMPTVPLAIALYAILAGLLILQPDIGQTLLITLVWLALFYMSGQRLIWVTGFASAGAATLTATYFFLPHVRSRIDRHLGGTGDTYQVDRALQSFVEGGFFGKGPGEGAIKSILPDAHTDFIFAVIGEEYGILACLALLGLYAVITLRALAYAVESRDLFTRLAVAGLTLMFAIQVLINTGVSVGLLPAKGMTLPLISSGGSSTIAIGITLGMVLALMRHRLPARAAWYQKGKPAKPAASSDADLPVTPLQEAFRP
jgi:cell division protein FtsW